MSKLICTMPVRNEDWVLGCSLRHVLKWVDEVVILDHASTDDTPVIISDIMREHPGRVHAYVEESPVWEEMKHRQFLLERARERGATHIVMVDADEVLTENLIPHIRPAIESIPAGYVMQFPWACLARSLDRYYTEGPWYNNWACMAFPDQPHLHWASRNGYDFHHRNPMGAPFRGWRAGNQGVSGLMHLQFVDERRLRAKQLLYCLTETVRWPGRSTPSQLNEMYGRAVYESNPKHVASADVPSTWWDGNEYKHLIRASTKVDPPWQELACVDMVNNHGLVPFEGLDFFGVL